MDGINVCTSVGVCVYVMDYYLTLEKWEIMKHVVTWAKLEDMMLNKVSLSQKDKYCRMPPLEIEKAE